MGDSFSQSLRKEKCGKLIWVRRWVSRQKNGCLGEWIGGWVDEWLDGWIGGLMDGWICRWVGR